MAYADLSELVVASARAWSPTFFDNVTTNNAMLNRLMKKGRIVTVDGGRTIDEALIYPTNPNQSYKWYTGYDSFTPPTTSEVLDAAEYQWKQLAGFISISGIEKIYNSGEAKRYDYVEARMAQLQALMKNAVATSIYSDGTGSGGRELGGLKQLIADDPTTSTTVGGINQATFSFWRNKTTGDVTIDGTTIQSVMNGLYLDCIRGSDVPDLILFDKNFYSLFLGTLQPQQRFMDSDLADLGFQTLKYQNADVIFDPNCNTNHGYFVNSDTIKLKCAPNRRFNVGDTRVIQNADYEVIPCLFAGNFTCNARFLNGVMWT